MGRVCDICGKGMIAGNKVSHSLRHTRRTWKPNLRRVRANVNGCLLYTSPSPRDRYSNLVCRLLLEKKNTVTQKS